jgi:hypothetical protein
MRFKTALLSGLLFASITGSAFAYDAQLKPFGDVQAADWSQDFIYSLSSLGIIDGISDTSYQPQGILSREAFVKLLVSAAKINTEAVSGNGPADVGSGRWSYPFITAAYQRHWIDFMLDANGAFRPEQTITREEVAALMGTFLLSAQPQDVNQMWSSSNWMKQQDTSKFADQKNINEPIRPAIYYTVNRGIMEGDQTGFRPKDPLTRKEAAAVVYRLIDSEMAGKTLDINGFYAIRSYPALNRMSALTNVTVGWSHLEYDTPGNARLNTESTEYKIPSGSEEVIQAADAAQVRKDLMVYYSDTNLKDFIKDIPAQESFIRSLTTVLQDARYSFTGVCIDFEGLADEASAPDYVRFLQNVKAKLGNRTLSVAVPPTYYYKGYDLQGIGQTADSVILMAYDFTHDDGHLPSAPLPLVNDAVEQALKHIPKEKLILGISKQANQWITQGGSTQRFSPEIADVEKRLVMPGSTLAWNLPYFLNSIAFQDERGSHEIYYEDSSSINKKLWLAKFYGLKGVSLWYMGNFTVNDWDLFAKQKK